MPAPITVVIPTLNAASELPATTEALLPGLTDGLVAELIISDGGSADQIAEVANELGARLVTGAKGRGAQLARGVAQAGSPWLLLLHADTHLSDGWSQAVRDHMESAPDKAGYFRLGFRTKGIWPAIIAGGANFRARFFGLPYGDQALLIHRDVLEKAGGIPDMPLMEDVALARALRGNLRPLDATALTSAARYEKDGWLRRAMANLGTLALYFFGKSPQALAERYNGKR